MGRIRTIKPEVNQDAKAARLPDDAWRLWVSSWVIADDTGVVPADPAFLGGQVFWAWPNPTERATRALASIREASMAVFYEVNGEAFMRIKGWAKHQKIDKPSGPKFPQQPGAHGGLSTGGLAKPRERSRTFDTDHDRDLDPETRKNYSPSLDLETSPASGSEVAPNDNQGVDIPHAAQGVWEAGTSSDIDETENVSPEGQEGARIERHNPTPRPRYTSPDEAFTLARLLMSYIVQNAPDSRMAKKPEAAREHAIERWAEPIAKLHRIDGQSWGTIEGAIHWVAKDPFWRAVILGGENLRDKWDTIALQRQRARPAAKPARKGPTALALEEQRQIEERERKAGAA